MTTTVLKKTRSLLEMIKFSHTIFAFPFALMGATLAALASGAAADRAAQIGWICLAMVGARSARHGAQSPHRCPYRRAKIRAPPAATSRPGRSSPDRSAGSSSPSQSASCLVAAVAMLNPLCFYLAPVVLGFF